MAFIRKEGKYYKVYFNLGGKKYKRSTRTASRKIAEDIRKKIENEIATGMFRLDNYTAQKQRRLPGFFAEALQYSRTNKAASTVQREGRVLKNFEQYFGNLSLGAVTVKRIEEYKNYLMEVRLFSPHSINIELRHLSAAFSMAVNYGYITANPFKKVKKVKTPKKKPKFLTPAQAEALLAHTRDKNIHQYIFISLNTGARISEVCNL